MKTISKNKYNGILYPVTIWIIFFIILLPFYNLGFDLTDEGWQLAKSWGILNGDFAGNSDLIWGSSYINGLWLSFASGPSLLWSRIFFLIFMPCFGVLAYLILKEFYEKKIAAISLITAFLLFNKTFIIYSSVNYYYLPVFASMLSFLFLIKFHKTEKLSRTYLILSGAFAGLTVHLKFTYFLIIPFMLIYFIFLCTKKPKLLSSVYFYISLFSAIIAGFAFLMISGSADVLVYEHGRLSVYDMFGYFFGTSSVNSSLNYSYSNLLKIYFKDLLSVINFTMAPLIILATLSFYYKKFNKFKSVPIIASAVLLYFFIYQNPGESYLKLISVFVLVQTALTLYLNKVDVYSGLKYYIFLSVFVLSFLGSGTGFYAGTFSLGFLGFTAYTLSASFSYASERFNTKPILPVFIIIGTMLQIFNSFSPYRDLPSSYLNTEFRSPELSGIYSFKERVEVVDEFLDFAKKENIRSDKVIFVAMPMFYYLLDVNPVISETHDVILGFEQLKKEVIRAEPDVIIVPVQSPRGQLWPLFQNADHWKKDGFERQTAHYYKFYNEYITENKFERIFENVMFIAYRKHEVNLKDSLP
ncbi:MAG TPA: hypothetical protein PLM72_08880 [Spirochaetota bacterium]|nr:hypothetical protein [Spirochaetota bacterium]